VGGGGGGVLVVDFGATSTTPGPQGHNRDGTKDAGCPSIGSEGSMERREISFIVRW